MSVLLQVYKQSELDEYVQLLTAIGSLSSLFSESETPFIHYRATENIYCKCFGADNLSRSDISYDALSRGGIGVGIKTFTGNASGSKLEKVAEFNTLSDTLIGVSDEELVERLCTYRNERIDLANALYNVEEAFYHIVAREKGRVRIFETPYDRINLSGIRLIGNDHRKSVRFNDGLHDYTFNRSKNTLFRRFQIPNDALNVNIEILKDPYDWILQAFRETSGSLLGYNAHDFVVLPLYSTKGNDKIVPQKSGLNQWNAAGRERDAGEMYIPVPSKIHALKPGFFPSRDTQFELITPDKQHLTAKICQDGGKALMTNPNKALSDWLLRKVLKLKEWELFTKERMELLEFDSVVISKIKEGVYKIDKAPYGSYEEFTKDPNRLDDETTIDL